VLVKNQGIPKKLSIILSAKGKDWQIIFMQFGKGLWEMNLLVELVW